MFVFVFATKSTTPTIAALKSTKLRKRQTTDSQVGNFYIFIYTLLMLLLFSLLLLCALPKKCHVIAICLIHNALDAFGARTMTAKRRTTIATTTAVTRVATFAHMHTLKQTVMHKK